MANTEQKGIRPLRLTPFKETAEFTPTISNPPSLPPINWSSIGQSAPQLPETPPGELPLADAVVITWAEAEWAALQHIFCGSGQSMPYSSRNTGSWSGWQQYTEDLPTVSGWDYWGYFQAGAARV
jgi:hypothetical protein